MTSRIADDGDENQRWRLQAECRPGNGYDPETWFPKPPNPYGTRKEQRVALVRRRDQEQRAKTICRRCPVRLECRDWAYTNDIRDGIWGGETPAERGVTPTR